MKLIAFPEHDTKITICRYLGKFTAGRYESSCSRQIRAKLCVCSHYGDMNLRDRASDCLLGVQGELVLLLSALDHKELHLTVRVWFWLRSDSLQLENKEINSPTEIKCVLKFCFLFCLQFLWKIISWCTEWLDWGFDRLSAVPQKFKDVYKAMRGEFWQKLNFAKLSGPQDHNHKSAPLWNISSFQFFLCFTLESTRDPCSCWLIAPIDGWNHTYKFIKLLHWP